jgi:hypothetical protein
MEAVGWVAVMDICRRSQGGILLMAKCNSRQESSSFDSLWNVLRKW